QPGRFDYEYVRNGTANLFMISEPLLGRRAGKVNQRRTAKDLAEGLRWVVEGQHPGGGKGGVGVDKLKTDQLACFSEALPPEHARRIAEKLEIHHTPKHGWWPTTVDNPCVSRGFQHDSQRNPGPCQQLSATTQARQLAECRGDRAERVGPAVPGPAHRLGGTV